MCRIDDCERSDASTTIHVKARAAHTCCECGRTISPGEQYAKTTSLFEGHWDTFKVCTHCSVAQKWLGRNCGGWVFEQVAEEIEEHANEYPAIAPGLERVLRGMRRQWKRGDRLMSIPRVPISISWVMKEAAR